MLNTAIQVKLKTSALTFSACLTSPATVPDSAEAEEWNLMKDNPYCDDYKKINKRVL